MTKELAGFLARLDDPELAALEPELAQRLLSVLFRDTGFSITIRDGSGHGHSLTDPGLDLSVHGAPPEFDDSQFRYLDAEGREVSRLRHPVHQVRMSGTAEHGVVIGLLGRGGGRRWFLASTSPLAQQSEGWCTLTIASEVSSLLSSRRDAELRSEMAEALLGLASDLLATRASDAETIASATRAFAAEQFPQCMVVISLLAGDDLRIWPVQLQPGMDPPPERMLPNQVRTAWSEGVHVNQAVDDTDIYGNIVVGGMSNPFRSVVMAPIAIEGVRRGSLAAVSLRPNAFSEPQIFAIEQAAALLGRALASAPGGAEQAA